MMAGDWKISRTLAEAIEFFWAVPNGRWGPIVFAETK